MLDEMLRFWNVFTRSLWGIFWSSSLCFLRRHALL